MKYSALFLSMTLLLSTKSAAKTFTIGVEKIQYLPHYSYEGDEYFGFARELFDSFSKDKGYTFKYVVLPINRLYSDFLAEGVDFKYPDSNYWNSEQKKGKMIHYSSPVVSYIDGVMVVPARVGKGLSSFKSLGTAMGFTPFSFLDLIKDKKVTIAENASFAGLLNQAIAGRVDGAYINISVARHQLTEVLKTPAALVYDPSLPNSPGTYHIATIKHPAIIEEINQWLVANQGKVSELKAKHSVTSE